MNIILGADYADFTDSFPVILCDSAAINPCNPRNPRLNHYQHLVHYCTILN